MFPRSIFPASLFPPSLFPLESAQTVVTADTHDGVPKHRKRRPAKVIQREVLIWDRPEDEFERRIAARREIRELLISQLMGKTALSPVVQIIPAETHKPFSKNISTALLAAALAKNYLPIPVKPVPFIGNYNVSARVEAERVTQARKDRECAIRAAQEKADQEQEAARVAVIAAAKAAQELEDEELIYLLLAA